MGKARGVPIGLLRCHGYIADLEAEVAALRARVAELEPLVPLLERVETIMTRYGVTPQEGLTMNDWQMWADTHQAVRDQLKALRAVGLGKEED